MYNGKIENRIIIKILKFPHFIMYIKRRYVWTNARWRELWLQLKQSKQMQTSA